jgi:ABC-type sugar transport system permease subunit
MTKKRVKKIGILQTSLISAIIFFFLSLILVVPIMLIMGIAGGFSDNMGFAFGGLLLMFMPIMYAIMGFLMTAFWCWLYNVIAKKIGGIEIEFEAMEE